MKRLGLFITRNKEIIVYLLVGVATTAINYTVYFLLFNIAFFSAVTSNIIAWIIAVVFAFVSNKLFVFCDQDWSVRKVFDEAVAFLECRIASGALETAIIFVATNFIDLNGNVVKVFTGILVIILNYIGSKLLVFRK